MTITCIGSGAFALAIATLLSKNEENKIHLWTHDENWKKTTKKFKKFTIKNQEYSLPQNTFIFTDLKEAMEGSELIFILVSTPFFKSIIKQLQTLQTKKKTIYIGTKGMLEEYPFFLTEYTKKKLKQNSIGSLGGPNLAQDLLANAPCSITFSYTNTKQKQKIKEAFLNNVKINFTKYSKPLELASTIKNVYAIGSGILSEKRKSQSTNLSYLASAYNELMKILYQNFFLDYNIWPIDITGDFFLTGTMQESRNLEYGKILVQKKDSKRYLTENTVEGVANITAIYNYFNKKKIKAPIFETIYKIIIEKEKIDSLEESIF